MKYSALLEVVLSHSFYSDTLCPDLVVAPSPETARLLRGHRCLWSAVPSGLRVMTAQGDSSDRPLIPIAAGTVLRFHLELQNSDFALFTDLAAVSALAVPVFNNASLAAGQGGELTLTSGTGGPLPRAVLAAVELRLADSGIAPVAPQFRLAFQAKTARWAYYCLTDLPASDDELTIADAQPGGPPALVFSDGNRTRLDEAADPADPVAAQFVGRYPGMRCVRIVSDAAVACRQEPRKYIELRRGTERLLSALPNPSVRNVVRMGSPHPPQDFLFQIVKYRTRPFA